MAAWFMLDVEWGSGASAERGSPSFGGEELGLGEEEIDGHYAGYHAVFADRATAEEYAARLSGGDLRVVEVAGPEVLNRVDEEEWDAYAVVLFGGGGHEVIIPTEFDPRRFDPSAEVEDEPEWTPPPPLPLDPEIARKREESAARWRRIAANANAIESRTRALVDAAVADGPCEALRGAFLHVPKARLRGAFSFDLTVACPPRPTDERGVLIPNPAMVLNFDGGMGLDPARVGLLRDLIKIPSLRYVVRVDNMAMGVDLHTRDGAAWITTKLTKPEDRLAVPEIGLDVALADLYGGAEFTPLEPAM